MTEHNYCILCDSKNLVNLVDYSKAYLCCCKSCGLYFSRKVPSKEELLDFYKNYGKNSYLSPLTVKRYNELLDKFEPYRKTNKILDVGCGIGFFLMEAKKRGWEVYGSEFSKKSVEICKEKGINIESGELDSNNYSPEMFDVITSFEVLEHINNPKKELNNFNKVLRKGGLVYLTTPNFNSLLRHRLKSAYNVITYPEHLTYYTPRTINKIFKTFGFKKQKIETTGISITRLRTSQGKSNQRIISEKSDDERIRIKMDNKWYLNLSKVIINSILNTLGVGDSLKGWFIKI